MRKEGWIAPMLADHPPGVYEVEQLALACNTGVQNLIEQTLQEERKAIGEWTEAELKKRHIQKTGWIRDALDALKSGKRPKGE